VAWCASAAAVITWRACCDHGLPAHRAERGQLGGGRVRVVEFLTGQQLAAQEQVVMRVADAELVAGRSPRTVRTTPSLILRLPRRARR
jgi:hypothetical protein